MAVSGLSRDRLGVAALALAAQIAVAAPAAPAATDLPPGVTARQSGAGVFFANDHGMSLYTYAQDTFSGKSACNAECARLWPPLSAPVGAAPVGAWTSIVRDDGTGQWALRGKPVYAFAKDNYAGAALGDRVGNAWNVAFQPIRVPPGVAIRSIYVGRILTDARGLTLYLREDEAGSPGHPPRSRCEGKCLGEWTALAAPLLAQNLGEWTVLGRADGTRQWAYQGHRLYLSLKDFKPGQTNGDGVERVWHVAVLDPAPALPDWVTVQHSDMGEIFADARGFTLYTFSGSLDKVRQTMCDDVCIRAFWRPVAAAPGAKPSGDWTLVPATPEAGLRWAYKGDPVYTHTRDAAPGAIAGDRWAGGVGGGGSGWMPIVRRRDFEE